MILPRPARLESAAGEFVLDRAVRIEAGPGAENAATLLAGYLGPGRLGLAAGESGPGITLAVAPDATPPGGYRLVVERGGVSLTAGGEAGLLHGVQTIRQLHLDSPGRWPCLLVEDAPRFGWRGVLLDVARHFMPLEFLYEFVDELALHKLNVLHLHLTDDQGWRVEITGWPLLTQVGAPGGHYTQDQLRELVAFAAARGVEIVPEIEMPGHAVAAIAAYPELGNRPEAPVRVWRRWGISEDVFGVGEHVFEFCCEVLRQVAEVFPSRHLHIGGDECPTAQWRGSPDAVRVAAEAGLEDADGLRSWFLSRIQEHVAGLGRRAVCWDEAGEGGDVAAGMTLTAWRDAAHSVRAVERGHRVIMAPHLSTYFDYPPDGRAPDGKWLFKQIVTLADVYHFDPGAGLPLADPGRDEPGVLGTQGQIWTEYAPTPDDVRRMAYPRLCALAEAAWSAGPRDYREFLNRLGRHRERLRALGALPEEWVVS